MRLSSFEDLGSGSETPILPRGDAIVGDKFVEFPEESNRLTPVRIRPERQSYPRFSRFLFPEVNLQGFRLFSIGTNYFTDHSLVDREVADADLRARMRFGHTEQTRYDPVKDAIEAVDPTHTVDCNGCAVIGSNEPGNFGSWLFRILPKALLLGRDAPVERVMVFSDLWWIPNLLRTFVPDVEIVPHLPHETYRLLNPTIPSLASADCFHRPEIQEALDPIIERAMRATPRIPDKIYISRRKMALERPGHRVLENETELVERLIPHGFQEFFPEDKTPLEQIAVCSQARIIVMAGGSNLFGCYFARRAAIMVDLEASEVFLEHHANVLASCGRPFSIVRGLQNERGSHDHHMNWTIDIDALLAGLGWMGALQ